MTVRLDRLQQGLFEVLNGADVADVVAWGYSEQAREAGSLLSLAVTTGPTPWNRSHARGSILCPADSIDIVVDAATVGTRQIIHLNDYPYDHDVVGGDTVTTIRDSLLADIQAGEAGAVTAAASGADTIALTADFLGGLRRLTLEGGDLSSASAVFSDDAVLETIGTMVHRVTITAYSPSSEPRNGAWSIIDLALSELQKPGVSETLRKFGLGVWEKGSPVNLSAVTGARWESRVAVDVTVASQSVTVETVDQIESATIAIAVTGDTVSETINATAAEP